VHDPPRRAHAGRFYCGSPEELAMNSKSLAIAPILSLFGLTAGCPTPVQPHGTGGAGGADSGTVHSIQPPPPGGPMPPPPNAQDVTFAISKLYLGDTDRDGTSDKVNVWKHYGFDLDHKNSTALSADLCQLRQGAMSKWVYLDGDGGIDNAFGKSIVP